MGEKKSRYDGYTEVRKQANLKYMSKFAFVRVRMEPEKLDVIKDYTSREAGMSVSGWINSLIDEELKKHGVTWPGE